VVPHKFDNNIHYPFGPTDDGEPVADIVYRPVPIYNESVVKKIMASVASGAAKRRAVITDIGAGVPKAPIVRELFVDAVTGQPIGKYINLKINRLIGCCPKNNAIKK